MEARDYIGERIGKLEIISELETHITPNGSRQRIFVVRCDCGNTYSARLSSIKKVRMCRKCASMDRRVDITGKRFGKLVVLSMADDYISPSGHRLSRCKCRCDCGKVTIVNMSGLVSGTTKSCGCIQNSRGLLKDYPVVMKEYDFEKNTGVDLDNLTATSHKKVWWKCSECGRSWEATVASRNDLKKYHGCPYCSGRLPVLGETDLLSQYPEVASEWDYEKNKGILPSEVTAKSSKKVWWKCEQGHSWKADISNRTNGASCPRCNIEKVNSFCEQAVFYYVRKKYPDSVNGDRHLGIELDIYIPSIRTAIEYDGEAWHNNERRKRNDEKKNNMCSENGIRMIRIREPRLSGVEGAEIIVREDSTTDATLSDAIKKLFLLILGEEVDVDVSRDTPQILEQYATKKKENSLAVCFPEVAKEWNYEKNGGLTPEQVSKASSRKVWWKCKAGHEYNMQVSIRTLPERRLKNGKIKRPQGCPYCNSKRILLGFNDLQTKNPQMAKEWHPTKNGSLTPKDVMPGSNKSVWWLCEFGHEWKSTINSRNRQGSGCPICWKNNRVSYNKKSVINIDTGEVYDSISTAVKSTGIKSISDCLHGRCKTAGGYRWGYY